MIRLRGIVHSFGAVKVLKGVDLMVARGECVVVSGAAGSGRSTLLRIVSTLVAPASGTIEIAGGDAQKDPGAARKHVAFADGWIAPGDEMQAAEYARFAAQVRSQAEAGRIAARAGIEPAKRLCSLDARERRTLAAACALATDRDVILLDEPFESSPSPSPLIEWIEEVKRAGSAVLIASNAAGAIDARVLELADGRLSAAAPAAAGGVSR